MLKQSKYYIGFALLTVGTFISLYLSHRRLWFKVSEEGGDRARVVFVQRTPTT